MTRLFLRANLDSCSFKLVNDQSSLGCGVASPSRELLRLSRVELDAAPRLDANGEGFPPTPLRRAKAVTDLP